jgi:hypothetical protein
MTNEERDIISQFIARVSGGPASSGFASGSVPATQPALPPVDRDADALIAQLFQQYPEARYRITQLAFVQEHALVEAQNRISRPCNRRDSSSNNPPRPAAASSAACSAAAADSSPRPRRGPGQPGTRVRASRSRRIISPPARRRSRSIRPTTSRARCRGKAPASWGRL